MIREKANEVKEEVVRWGLCTRSRLSLLTLRDTALVVAVFALCSDCLERFG